MTDPTSAPEPAAAADQPSGAEPAAAARATRPYDPERGLRGAMSATLVLEAITVLLAIPVAANTGGGVGPAGVVIICLLAVLLIGACAIVSRPYAVPVIVTLQALMIACWVITPPLGIMGVVFGLVWALILWFRGEFRRRLAAGTLPGPTAVQQ